MCLFDCPYRHVVDVTVVVCSWHLCQQRKLDCSLAGRKENKNLNNALSYKYLWEMQNRLTIGWPFRRCGVCVCVCEWLHHCFSLEHTHTHIQGFLAAEEDGDSLDTVEALMKKHDNFEKTLEAQEEKFKVNILFCADTKTNIHLLSGYRWPCVGVDIYWSLCISRYRKTAEIGQWMMIC